MSNNENNNNNQNSQDTIDTQVIDALHSQRSILSLFVLDPSDEAAQKLKRRNSEIERCRKNTDEKDHVIGPIYTEIYENFLESFNPDDQTKLSNIIGMDWNCLKDGKNNLHQYCNHYALARGGKCINGKYPNEFDVNFINIYVLYIKLT